MMKGYLTWIRLIVFLCVMFLSGQAFAVVKIAKSPERSPYIECQGIDTLATFNFTANKILVSSFLEMLRNMGYTIVIGDDLTFPKDAVFTYVPQNGITNICDLVKAFAKEGNVFAKINNKTITFYRYRLLSYTLPLATSSIERNILYSGQKEQATNKSLLSSKLKISWWNELQQGLSMILGTEVKENQGQSSSTSSSEMLGRFKESPRFWVDRATGTLFVKAKPSQVKEVNDFINKLSDKYSKVIKIRLMLFEFTTDDGTYYKASWQQAINKFLNANWLVGGEASSVNFPSNEQLWQLGYKGLSANSLNKGILEILKSYGNAKLLDQAVVYLSNGYPAEIARGFHQEYVSSFSKETTDTGTTISVEKGEILSGIRFSFYGHVVDDKNWDGPPSVFLNIYSNINRLENLATFDTGQGYVQNPTFTGRSNFLTMVVPSGKPVVLVALKSDYYQKHRSFPPIPFLGRILGSYSRSHEKKTILVVLVPEIMDIKNVWGSF